eukprot:1710818-Prymnesium_polylepis.1
MASLKEVSSTSVQKEVMPVSTQSRRELEEINTRVTTLLSANEDVWQQDDGMESVFREELSCSQEAITAVIGDFKKQSQQRKNVLSNVDHALAMLITELRKEEDIELDAREDKNNTAGDADASD